jgi:hypothetical protein
MQKLSKKVLFSFVSLTFALISTGYGFKGAGVLPVWKNPKTGEETLLVGNFDGKYRQFGNALPDNLQNISNPYDEKILKEVAKQFNLKTASAIAGDFFANDELNIETSGKKYEELANKKIVEKLKMSGCFISRDRTSNATYLVYKLEITTFIEQDALDLQFKANMDSTKKEVSKKTNLPKSFHWIPSKFFKSDLNIISKLDNNFLKGGLFDYDKTTGLYSLKKPLTITDTQRFATGNYCAIL